MPSPSRLGLLPRHLRRFEPVIQAADPGQLIVLDMHAAGEPVRIALAGYPELAGDTILAKRRAAQGFDHLRRRMNHEPRGHAGMYGVLPVAPSSRDADVAVLFTHASGYSTMCGHATLAIGRWLADCADGPSGSGRSAFKLECPCGVVDVEADGDVTAFLSVPSFLAQADVTVETGRFGRIACDVAYGGAYYAILAASALGFRFEATDPAALVRTAHDLLVAARSQVMLDHPGEPDLAFLYGVILTDDASPADPETRHVCVFGDGQLDRSPTGSGVTARIARDVARGLPGAGTERRYVGPSGLAFTGRCHDRLTWHSRPASIVRVAGRAHYSGLGVLIADDNDPLKNGFEIHA
ncbi:proline racemase family protein [Marinivivus vitaminiproducens]|uniref:proline racemase family protein n=1 Tax=Marinivivus vitaminiproducens TaxID=3035935 RepID=UPI0027A28F95|nr:proline racemase family protein [Geminicoccaceae bacterium SCSIO 64248]